jgi:two-component system sensor histidine kinase GlrK
MGAMRWARPKSVGSLMLLGLVLAALPLAVAVLNAAVQMRSLASTGQELVMRGIEATRSSQVLLSSIASMERTARLYQVLGDRKLLDAYAQTDRRLTATRETLRRQLVGDDAMANLDSVARVQTQLREGLRSTSPGTRDFAALLRQFDALNRVANRVADGGNRQLEAELEALRTGADTARQRLIIQSSLLIPLTLVVVLLVTYWLGRPLREIDRAISELGRGTFDNPITVRGPEDLERLGRQLEWLRVRLLELAQERNRFLRHMSHELKTPLANIREGADLLMDGAVGPLDSNQREVLGILRDNGLKLQRLIENLLSFSAWQSQSLGVELSEFKLRPLVKQVLENQQLTLLSQRVRLDMRVDDVNLYADRGKLRLILENLLSNAIKYSPREGEIHVIARKEGDQLVLDVADSGEGIAAEDRAHVFDAFYTGRPSGSSVKGTGIGLSVVMEFASAQGGTVEIVDGVFPGAHFRLRLPLRVSEPDPPDQAHAS